MLEHNDTGEVFFLIPNICFPHPVFFKYKDMCAVIKTQTENTEILNSEGVFSISQV